MDVKVAIISARGNAESVLAFLVLFTCWCIRTKRLKLAGLVYGFSVHLKIYPIIYCIPLWFGVDYAITSSSNSEKNVSRNKPNKFTFQLLTWTRIKFGMISGGMFLLSSWCMYVLYIYILI